MAQVAQAPVRQELLDASDEAIEDAVKYADPMALRGLLFQLTGDEQVAATTLKTVRVGFFESAMVATDEEVALLREKAVEFLIAYRDSGAGPIGTGPGDRLIVSTSLAAGQDVPEEQMELWRAELALDPWARGLKWRKTPSRKRLEEFSVTVIGAGTGGLNQAVQLKRAGFPYTVIEKDSGVGGTWFENRYPGARVDTPSRTYSHVFGVDYPFTSAFCTWTENQQYFDWIADTFEVRNDIVFNTEVRSLVWDEDAAMWEITTDGPGGERVQRSKAVVTSVGFLNQPRLPEIEGMADFQGPSWHTARWPDDIDLTGKRVAVIGTGCSGYQVVPQLALTAGHLTVFQRRPQWLFEIPGYTSPLPPEVGWLDRNLPYHTNFMRLRAMYRRSAGGGGFADIDPDFHDPYAVSAGNKQVRDSCIAFLERKLGSPELVAKMTPPHPPFSARPVLVDADYCVLDAIQRDNVSLVTEGIRRINRTGIEANDGSQHDFDAIVYATGFRASDYLFPMTVKGRGGRTINDLWAHDGARAYLGCMMPGFPNLWSLYGPNTNGGLLVPAIHELTTLYGLQCMEQVVLEEMGSIEVKEDAYRRYNRLLDERSANRAYSKGNSYYWSEYGRTITNCPFSAVEMWKFLQRPDFDDLELR